MPVYISEIIQEANLTANMPKLLQLFYDLNLSSPMNCMLNEMPYRYANYKYDPTEIFTNTIIKAVLDNLFNKRCGLMPHLEELVHRIISIAIPSIKDTQDITRAHSIIFLMTNAVRFALIKIGNCSERSAYSALVLAEVFQGTKIRVGLQSMTRVDHVAVTLGPIAGLYYVYDPFINPEIIIPLKEYQENIYPKLPKSANVLPKIKLTIDGHILEMYKVNKGGIMERIIERINDASADQLWSQSEFRETLSINRYNKEHLNQAREILNIAIEQQKVAVGISPEGSFEL